MEPMTLGSTPSSPSSPGTRPKFLPPFLMGEPPQTPKTIIAGSPDKNRSFGMMDPSRQRLFNTSTFDSPSIYSSDRDIGAKSGPPRVGLFDSFEVAKSSTLHTSHIEAPFNSSLPTDSFYPSLNRSVSQPTFDDSIRIDRHENVWVTVFGFSPNSASVVLSRLSSCGVIVDKKYPAQGNWIHLKYSTPYEAANALALNGKLVSNSIMVGVVAYQRSKEANKENSGSSFTSPVIRARPLRAAVNLPQSPNTSLTAQNVPQKSTGLVTRAMEYMLGW